MAFNLVQNKANVSKNYDTFGNISNLKIHPEKNAGLLSRLFFSWMNPLLQIGNKRQLNPQDIWPLNEENKCGPCSNKLMANWDGQSSLVPALNATYGCRYYALGLLLFGAYACDFFGPIVLNVIVNSIKQPSLNIVVIYQWLGLLFLSRVIKSILFAHFYYQTQIIMLQFTSAMKGFVYQKALRLNAKSRGEKNTGDIVNIYTTDVANIINAAFMFHYLWVLPVQIIAAIWMLYSIVGVSTFAGVGVIIIALLLNNINAHLQSKYFEKIMKIKDERMKVVNELFGAIQIVKLNAWENKFVEKLMNVRKRELLEVWYYLRTGAINIFLLWGVPVFVSTATFAVYVLLMHESLTAGKVFTSIALFRLLQEPLRSLPSYISGVIQAGVSIKRLKEFSVLKERDPSIVFGRNSTIAPKYQSDNTAVSIENGTFKWDEEGSPLFSDINLNIKSGDFVVIHGKVGGGKSSLCSVLLGEMIHVHGTVYVGGQVAYCPQQSWIQNQTIRENILFGSPYDKKKYDKVIESCGLKKDLGLFVAGDKTEIGQKGLNLSGGQKARISLARACYSEADIFIFDSPLSAVDAIVQNEIFTKCMLGLLRHKTRILVTHSPEIIASKYVNQSIDISGGQFNTVAYKVSEPLQPPAVSPLPSRRIHVPKATANAPVGKQEPPSKGTKALNVSFDALPDEGFTSLTKKASSFIGAQSASFVGDSTGQLVLTEERQSGRVSVHVFKSYFRAIGGLSICFFLIFVQIVWQAFQIGSDFWLGHWTSETDQEQKNLLHWNITVYAVLALGGAFMVYVRTLTISLAGIKAANTLFTEMTSSLVKAPMSFFDANPVGRQLNRYSDDVSNVDFRLPFAFGSLLAVFFSTGATLLTAAVVTRFLGILIIPLIYVYFQIGAYYLATARELQRLQKVTQSPVLAHVSESVDGAVVIRAFGSHQVERFTVKNQDVIDTNNSNQFASFAVSEWFAMRMQLMGGVILFVITASLCFMRDYLSAGIIGLAFNYGLSVDQGLESLIQIWSWLETSMISPERIQEYIDVTSEAPHEIPETKPNNEWPDKGEVIFENVSFRYKADGKIVLQDLCFQIKAKEKIGIVGRTGAGKSSLAMALFRINELSAGKIVIDGIDVSKLGLATLRSRISIITQAPVLFKGTLRGYLDPFNEYSDNDLWSSLRKVELADSIGAMKGKLEAPLEENGENFSVGERQMLCMARALLSDAKVVLMDEATASIDQNTDMVIQKVIRSEFENSTVITIAHRLDTVLDCDRIIVLDAGKIIEFDSPKALINQGQGHFFDLAKEGGYLDRMKL